MSNKLNLVSILSFLKENDYDLFEADLIQLMNEQKFGGAFQQVNLPETLKDVIPVGTAVYFGGIPSEMLASIINTLVKHQASLVHLGFADQLERFAVQTNPT